MARIVIHVRFLIAVHSRLVLTRRGLRPRLPGRLTRTRAIVVTTALWLRAATKQPVPIPRLRLLVATELQDVRVRSEGEFFGAYEVFATRDYDLTFSGPVRHVLDLGANVGFASMLLAERYPEAQIVAIEPAPDTFATLTSNVATLDRVHTLQLAVGGDATVYLNLEAPSVERSAGTHGIAVRSVGLTTLLDELGWADVDVMKIDAEGAEFEFFADPALARVRAIIGEVHTAGAPADYTDVAGLLPSFAVDTNPAVTSSATMFRAVRR